MDMIIADESPSSVTDKIKELIQGKAVGKIEELRPYVSSSLFGETIGTDASEEE